MISRYDIALNNNFSIVLKRYSIFCFIMLSLLIFAYILDHHISLKDNLSDNDYVCASSLRSPSQLVIYPQFDVDFDDALPLEGRVIFLDPGHGGHDPGCVYPLRNPEYFEKDFNLSIALETAAILEDLGATVILTRTYDEWLSIYARAALLHLYVLDYWDDNNINTLPDDVSFYLRSGMLDTIRVNSEDISDGCMGPMVGSGFSDEMIMLLERQYPMYDFLYLSIHINWNSQSSIRGVQVYYVTDQEIIKSEKRLLQTDPYYYDNPDYVVRKPYYGRDGEHNAILAQIMYDSIIASAPEMAANTQKIVESNFAVLREHGIPSVMIEAGFLSNETDREFLSDPEVIQKISIGIAEGCLEYFEYVDLHAIVE